MIADRKSQPVSLRIAGLLGVGAAFICSIADAALFYSPDSPLQFKEMFSMAKTPEWRLLLGHFLGIVFLPLQSAGYWQVYVALKPAGKKFSLPIFLLGVYLLACGTALHGVLGPYALVLQARSVASLGAQSTLSELLAKFEWYIIPLFLGVYSGLLLISAWYFVAVFFKRTQLPRWMGFFNKFVLLLLLGIVIWFLPGPIKRLLLPAVTNLSNLVFFAINTIALWHVDGLALSRGLDDI